MKSKWWENKEKQNTERSHQARVQRNNQRKKNKRLLKEREEQEFLATGTELFGKIGPFQRAGLNRNAVVLLEKEKENLDNK